MTIRNTAVYDPMIPGARLLREPKKLDAVLSSLLPDVSSGSFRVHLHRHLPGKRCVATVDTTCVAVDADLSPRRSYVIKLYADDQGSKVFATLRRLRARGFSSGPFTICRPLAYDPAWGLLILERAPGETLRSYLFAEETASQAADAAARWLLALRNCGLTDGRLYSFDRHLQTLANQGERLAASFPEPVRLFRDLVGRIAKQARPLAQWSPAPTHRDFTPDHLFWNGDQLTGLDFDEFCQYDPLFDVGHFLAHLRLISLNHPAARATLDRVARTFQARYQSGAPDYSVPRVDLYQAIACLKLAYVVGVVERPGNAKAMVTALVHEAAGLCADYTI